MKDKLKGAWRSWTIHFNLWIAVLIEGLPMMQESFPQLQPYVPANLFQWGMGALIIGNMMLRFRTKCALESK